MQIILFHLPIEIIVKKLCNCNELNVIEVKNQIVGKLDEISNANRKSDINLTWLE